MQALQPVQAAVAARGVCACAPVRLCAGHGLCGLRLHFVPWQSGLRGAVRPVATGRREECVFFQKRVDC